MLFPGDFSTRCPERNPGRRYAAWKAPIRGNGGAVCFLLTHMVTRKLREKEESAHPGHIKKATETVVKRFKRLALKMKNASESQSGK